MGRVFRFGEQLRDARIEGGEGEEGLVAEPGEDPALGHQHPGLDFRLVAGLGWPGGEDGGAVVLRELLVGALQPWLVPAGQADAALELIAHDGGRDAAEEGEGADVAGDPVGHLLGAGRRGVGVVRGAEDGDKQLDREDLARGRVDEPGLLAGVVDEALLPGAVDLAHGQPAALEPGPVEVAEARVAVAVGVPLQVLEVEQLQGDAGPAALGVDPSAIRRRALPLARHLGPAVEPALQDRLAQRLGLGPVQPGPSCPDQDAADRAQPDPEALGDCPVAEPQRPLLSEDFTDLPHG
jgi:hypothetical protein